MNSAEESNKEHLFIIGVPKSGTTSLFGYLAAHPQVSPCRIKEPGYFLPIDDYMITPLRFGKDPLDAYLAMYPTSPEFKLRIEGTTHYFRRPEIARVINDAVPDSKVLVSFREPISRLVSFYQMGTHGGWIDSSLTFDEVIQRMLNWRPEYHIGTRQLLEEGRYSNRLLAWREIYGPDRMLVIWFDDINSRPLYVMNRISEFINIDESFYADFDFDKRLMAREYRSVELGQAYTTIKFKLKEFFGTDSLLIRSLSGIHRLLTARLYKFMSVPAGPIDASASTVEALLDYYSQDLEPLAKAMNEKAPWAEMYERGDIHQLNLSRKLRIH